MDPIQSSGAMSPVTSIKVTENKIVSKAFPPYTGITCRKHRNVMKRITIYKNIPDEKRFLKWGDMGCRTVCPNHPTKSPAPDN